VTVQSVSGLVGRGLEKNVFVARDEELPRFENSRNLEMRPQSVFYDTSITRSSILEGAFISTHMADFHVSGIPETWDVRE
jgi:hypothetical protein